MAKNYCVCILFNKDLTKTLLIKKAEGKLFAGMFNGLGGKLEQGKHQKRLVLERFLKRVTKKLN